VFLVGDAAHAHSPAGAQGINTGVEDATTLTWRLAGVCRTSPSTPDTRRVFAEWEGERHQVVENVLRDTDLQTRLWGVRGLRRRVRDAVLSGAERMTLLDRVVTPRQTQIAQRYRPAPGQPRPKAVGIVRGHARLPNVEVPALHTTGAHLHDFLSMTEPVSIVFDPDGVPGAHTTVERWVDPDTGLDVVSLVGPALRSALRISRRVTCVVRPDGIVAAVSEDTATRRLLKGANS
ncbi:FAD-dependent monooxygenase, partial [Actinokineospora sp.]|uniref:FAD-dependent monooxygenase n=1 Tax=Actinokineospora sp. TaxID=1872133 RepID=UPI003D6C2D98